MNQTPDLTPENKVLRAQAESLKKDFAELYEKWSYMLSYEEATLTSVYLTELGGLKFRLFRAQTELAQLKQKIQLAQAYFNRNELPDWAKIDKSLAKQVEEYHQKIKAEAERIAAAKEYLRTGFLNEQDALQLKQVYRQLVKELHPDLHPDQSDAERELFLRVQAAYSLCDLQALNEILLLHGSRGEISAAALPDLLTVVRNLSVKVNDLQAKVDKLNQGFPFVYRDKLQDEIWLAIEKQTIEQQIELIVQETKMKTDYLLLLESWRPESLN